MAIVGKTRESMGEIEKDRLKPLNDLLQNFVIWSQKCENFPSPSCLGSVLDFWGQAGGPGHFCQQANRRRKCAVSIRPARLWMQPMRSCAPRQRLK
jgi:hypothetical protein